VARHLPPLLAFALALVPAALVLRRGCALASLIDDPAFAERRLAANRTSALETAFAAGLLATFLMRHAWWSLALLLVARVAAAIGARGVVRIYRR
jgi:hypothetical protein